MAARSQSPHAVTVKQLQARLEATARAHSAPRKNRLSRHARLQLIDKLSRWSGLGVAFIAGISIFLAVTIGRSAPYPASVWLLMVGAALYACRRLTSDFRSGEKSASRPFRWRANYTSAVTVLSAAFGAGALILPFAANGLSALSLMAAGAAGAAGAHIAHGRSAAAVLAPAGLFISAAAYQMAGLIISVFGFAAFFVAAGVGLFLASRRLQAITGVAFPRTKLLRRGPDDPISASGVNADCAERRRRA